MRDTEIAGQAECRDHVQSLHLCPCLVPEQTECPRLERVALGY